MHVEADPIAIYRPARRGGGITAGVADLEDEGEVYSDDEGGPGGNVIDMGAISTQGESAPTALIRAGRETGKAKGEAKDQKEKDRKAKERAKKRRDKGKERASASASASDGMVVKPEPISPEKRDMALAPDVDVDVDMDMEGTATPENEAEEVEVGDPDQGLDLSESEDEEEEETMEGDFVQAEGMVRLFYLTVASVSTG
jgi:DNA-directed RNA polymerase III subunit RPC4